MRGDKRHQRQSLLYQSAMRNHKEKCTPSGERGGEGRRGDGQYGGGRADGELYFM